MDEGIVPVLDETRKTPKEVIVNRVNASWDKVRYVAQTVQYY